jgi:hypothetical protein
MFSVSFSATCIVHGISYMFDQMESLDDDDLTSSYGTSQCSKSYQLKVSMINPARTFGFSLFIANLGISVNSRWFAS